MAKDYLQKALVALRPDNPDWYSWAKEDSDGNTLLNSERMTFEHAYSNTEGVTKPTQAEFDAKVSELKLQDLRAERNNKLAETDWVVTMHKELGTNIPAAWKTYRQALRDITDNYSDLDTVVWPTKP